MAKRFTQAQIDKALATLMAWGGNARAAADALNSDTTILGDTVGADTLASWKVKYQLEYNRIRQEHAPQLEGFLANEFRDLALKATRVIEKAIDVAEERLDAGKDHDPARTAASLAQVKAKAIDKLMTLEGREPRQEAAKKTVEELMRGLVASGVLSLPQLPNGDAS